MEAHSEDVSISPNCCLASSSSVFSFSTRSSSWSLRVLAATKFWSRNAACSLSLIFDGVSSDGLVTVANASSLSARFLRSSQRDLAAKLGRLPSMTAKIESGQRRIDAIEFFALARALEVPPEAVLGIAVSAIDESEPLKNFSRSKRSDKTNTCLKNPTSQVFLVAQGRLAAAALQEGYVAPYLPVK